MNMKIKKFSAIDNIPNGAIFLTLYLEKKKFQTNIWFFFLVP